MDQLEYDNYHCVSWGFMDGWRCHVRVALFFVDHVVQPSILSWAVFGDKRSGDMVLFFCFFMFFCWQNKNVEQFPLGPARGMIYSAHTHLPLLTKTRLAHTFSFFPLSASHSLFFSHPITLLLPSAQCKLHSHFFPSPTTVTHIYPHPLLHPPNTLPGVS